MRVMLRSGAGGFGAARTAKIRTLITLGVRHRAKALVLESRKLLSCGFDSHRPLHFSLPGVSLRCPRTRLSLSPSSRSGRPRTTA
jgi:hypothetical protein